MIYLNHILFPFFLTNPLVYTPAQLFKIYTHPFFCFVVVSVCVYVYTKYIKTSHLFSLCNVSCMYMYSVLIIWYWISKFVLFPEEGDFVYFQPSLVVHSSLCRVESP